TPAGNGTVTLLSPVVDVSTIAPVANVTPTGVTQSGNTVTITTTAPHGLTVGETVAVAGVGSPAATITGSAGVAASPTGAVEAGNTVTVTTTAPHGFAVGQTAVLSGLAV